MTSPNSLRGWPNALGLAALLIGLPASAGHRSHVDIPELEGLESFSRGDSQPVNAVPWWSTFAEPTLDSAMDEALGSNQDLAAAWARVEQAKAGTLNAASPLLPTVSFDGQGAWNPKASLGFGFIPDQGATGAYFQGSAKINANLQVDLFGRNVLSWQAARYDADASRGDRDAQALAISAMVANAWFDVVFAREQVSVVEGQIATNEDLLAITEVRYDNGATAGLDVLQQRQNLAATKSLMPPARTMLSRAEYNLAVLLGRPPTQGPATAEDLPSLPGAPTVGVPADLLDNRPDLRAATARKESAHRRKNSAVRALLPSVGANASAGWQAFDADGWNSQTTWTVGVSASLPIFQGGRNIAAIRSGRAQEAVADHGLRQALLGAVQDVETALMSEEQSGYYNDARLEELDAAKAAFESATNRYERGLANHLTVLTALQAQQRSELNQLKAQRDLITARIQLHQSLGGGWLTNLPDPQESR